MLGSTVESCDVVVVGTRLAGAAAAVHLARAGHRVVALDRSRFPSDQLSTHLLFPSGVHELERMGALEGILASDPVPSRWLSLSAGSDVHVSERWRASGPIDYCLCVPRTIQDLELVRAARAAGVDVREQHRVLDVLWRGGRACGVRYVGPDGIERQLHARLVLGADGRRSAVAAAVGSYAPYRGSLNGRGLIFRYGTDPLSETRSGETIHQWRNGDSIGFMFPSAPRGKALLLFMGPSAEVKQARLDPDRYWEDKLREHPGMAERTAGVTDLGPLRSTADTSAYFRVSSGPGWALIGDAGHFKDPVIGQGQRDALWSGRAVAEAVSDVVDDPAAVDCALRRWERERDAECLHSYHFGNIETRLEPTSPVLLELLRRASRNEAPDVSDLFGRSRTLPQVVSLRRVAVGLIDALVGGGTTQPPTAVIAGALTDLRTHLGIRQELLGRRFRSTRLVAGSEHPHPLPPARPVTTTTRRPGRTEIPELQELTA